ncbi:hypothetical protein Pelo_19107 [Pelomyxa schiedti]|nr:hypothetical protein Pelo_19107 [Pelomyxa schiedti]
MTSSHARCGSKSPARFGITTHVRYDMFSSGACLVSLGLSSITLGVTCAVMRAQGRDMVQKWVDADRVLVTTWINRGGRMGFCVRNARVKCGRKEWDVGDCTADGSRNGWYVVPVGEWPVRTSAAPGFVTLGVSSKWFVVCDNIRNTMAIERIMEGASELLGNIAMPGGAVVEDVVFPPCNPDEAVIVQRKCIIDGTTGGSTIVRIFEVIDVPHCCSSGSMSILNSTSCAGCESLPQKVEYSSLLRMKKRNHGAITSIPVFIVAVRPRVATTGTSTSESLSVYEVECGTGRSKLISGSVSGLSQLDSCRFCVAGIYLGSTSYEIFNCDDTTSSVRKIAVKNEVTADVMASSDFIFVAVSADNEIRIVDYSTGLIVLRVTFGSAKLLGMNSVCSWPTIPHPDCE